MAEITSAKPKIIAVAGPTASGKTSLSVALSKRFGGEVVSCDSMQLYKGMDIGTAKATPDEQQGVAHHLIDTLDINEVFSVSDYVKLAEQCVKGIYARNHIPVFCGGTGLYLDSFIKGLDFGEYENVPGLREELAGIAASEGGVKKLHDELSLIDPQAAADIHPSNVKRVIRAIEIYRSSGITPTEQKRRSLLKGAKYDSLIIGLCFSDREELYRRIDLRVDIMLEQGLIEEAKLLYQKGLDNTPTAGAAIGYKELFPYICGNAPLDECVEILKRESRRYAKRQMTWFSRNPDIKWICADSLDKDEIAELASAHVREFLEN